VAIQDGKIMAMGYQMILRCLLSNKI